jgi:ribosomal protein S18 acetylase RimI-like enzyme
VRAEIHIRACTSDDRARVWEIRHGTVENRLLDPLRVSDAEVDWYQDQAIFLVSEDDAGTQGFVCANHQTGYIWALFVIDGKQGQGHGSALLAEVERRLGALGHRQMFLTTGPDTSAAGWYARRGFRTTGTNMSGETVFVKAL